MTNAILRVGTICCWFIGIAGEYVAQAWPRRKIPFTVIAILGFVLALAGELGTYEYEKSRDAEWQAKLDAVGIPEAEWFHARSADQQTFTLKFEPLPGSVELLINGLIEPEDTYSVGGQKVTLSTRTTDTDAVIIRYRRRKNRE